MKRFFVSQAVAHKYVSFEEVGDGMRSLYFYDQLLARLDDRDSRLRGGGGKDVAGQNCKGTPRSLHAPRRRPALRLYDGAPEVCLPCPAPHAVDEADADVARSVQALSRVGAHRLEPPERFR